MIPTYGATPTAVGIKPRYNARMPPSSRMILMVILMIERSPLLYFGRCEEGFADRVGDMFRDILAVAIDSRARTRSRGYVVPKNQIE